MKKSTVNQKRGPTVGNAGTPAKRDQFIKDKSSVGSERQAIADMITGALATRGNDVRSYRNAGVEPLKADVNVGKKK